MAGGLVTFALMVTVIKALGSDVPLPQLLVIRQIIMMTLLAPLFLRDPVAALRTAHPLLQVVRGLCTLGAMYFSFMALRNIPLADSTALGFAHVLFVTVLAVLVLKEKVSIRRWIATGAGFMGVLIMLRPGAGSFDVFALAALLGALCNSGISISVRLLSGGERTSTILLWQGLVLLAVLAVPAALTWVPLSPIEWAAMGLIGLSGTLGQWFMTRAYQTGEAASLAPLDFSKLLLNTLTGWLIFSEVPHAATIAGATLIIGATLVVLRSNAAAGPRKPPED